MPSEVSDIKQFLEIARRKDATGALFQRSQIIPPRNKTRLGARLKKSTKGKDIKLKLRGKRFLYTLKLKDSDKADKIKQSLPPTLPFQEINKTTKKAKK
ncbi:hypothetical protein LTR84_000012 [Exophiala bonariae]|uniref:60S ribosomal protein L38 n=1 Tax=Exophiala bonariae TaxID=1690606 RepID=A0AAV9NPW0_9EURO|nr:hypothetical protein LTR84_000012 [Exophiala bonariae]